MGYAAGCHSLVPIGERRGTACDFPGQGRGIWLVGDSNGGMYAEAVSQAGRQLDRPVHLATASGCPLVDVVIHEAGRDPAPCRNFVRKSVAYLVETPPSTVVLAAANEHVTNQLVGLSNDDQTVTYDEREKAELWESGVRSVVKQLTASGHSVIVVEASPHLKSTKSEEWFSPAECSTISLLRDPKSCDASVSLESENKRQAIALEAERRGTITGGGTLMSVRSEICRGQICSAQRDGEWIFRDGLHISVSQSKRMTTTFTKEIQER